MNRPMVRCEVHDLAREDVDHIVDYLLAEQPDAAERWAVAFVSTQQLLSRFPRAGRKLADSSHAAGGIRFITVGKFRSYIVVYEVTQDAVVILRVVRAGADLKGLA